MHKNMSVDNFLCDDGNLYKYGQYCVMNVNEYKDVVGCRDLSHLQECGKMIIYISIICKQYKG
jgi:hypothetical protein